jgi:hypothetical protein
MLAATLVAAPILALNLLWQERTLGHPLTSPYAEYSRQYFPFVRPGFGVDPSPPARDVPREITWLGESFRHLHAAHVPAALPGIAFDRALTLLLTLTETRTILLAAVLWGAMLARGALAFGVASIAALLAGYLIYAHPARWVVYYVEVFPIVFAVAAAGIDEFLRRVTRLDAFRAAAAIVVAVALFTPWFALELVRARREKDAWHAFQREGARVLAGVQVDRAIIFVRYPPDHLHHFSLTHNTPDYREANQWIVPDRGERNIELLQMTDRPAFRLTTDTWTLERLR